MQAEERQHRIEAYLQRVEFASLEELAKQVDASVSTVRRDLTLLEAGGLLRRTHGGARLVAPRSDEFAFTARDTEIVGELFRELHRAHADPAAVAEKECHVAAIVGKLVETFQLKAFGIAFPLPNLWLSS